MYIAIVSTTVETTNPIAELNPGIALLKDIVERFDSVNDLLAPVADGTGDKCYISKSYDATRWVICAYQYHICVLKGLTPLVGKRPSLYIKCLSIASENVIQ